MEILYKLFEESIGISTDTRKLQEGELFFALKGERFDANEFVERALDKNPIAVVTSNVSFQDHDNCIYVPDTLVALQNLANHHRKHLNIPVIALSGSNGKTTTKELMAALLATRYNVGVTQGNLNNHIGVPLTLLTLDDTHDLAVIEMGANHQGEIAALCEIAEPDYGYLTNIGLAHLEGFGGEEGVKKGKGELFDFIKKKEGIIFINSNQPKLVDLAGDYEHVVDYNDSCIPFGEQTLVLTSNDTSEYASFSIIQNELSTEVRTRLVGQYNVRNIIGSLVIAGHFQCELDDCLSLLEGFSLSMNRSEKIMVERAEIILDAYNANPTSMKAALSAFFLRENNRQKAVVLGDMLELGEHSFEAHKQILELLANQKNLQAILVGPHFGAHRADYPFKFYDKTEEAKSQMNNWLTKDWSILIKGSRGIALEKLLPNLT